MCFRGPVSGTSSRVACRPHGTGDAASGDRQPPSAIRGRAARGSSVRGDYSSAGTARLVSAAYRIVIVGWSMSIEWIERDGARIVAVQRIGAARPDDIWRLWTEPGGLTRWWPDEAEVDPVARTLHLSWPPMEWHLRGRILEWDAPRRLAFTWRWDHEPGLPERTVTVARSRRLTATARY